jgi:amino acid adenylation domain-containing protein
MTSPFLKKLLASFNDHSTRVALICGNQKLTYGELFSEASKLSKILLRAGVVAGDRVAIYGERSTSDYISILATLISGASYVPLNTQFPLDRIEYVLQKSGSKALLIDSESKNLFSIEGTDTNPLFSGLRLVMHSDSHEIVHENVGCNSEHLFLDGAYIMFTSGTTGQPKGVPITQDNLHAYFSNVLDLYPVFPDDVVVNTCDLSFDVSVHEVFCAWLSGAALCVVPRKYALLASRYVKQHRATVWSSVPSVISLGKNSKMLPPESMESIRLGFFCGEALSKETSQFFNEAAPNALAVNIYGPTEATISFTHYPIDFTKELPPIIPIGLPYPNQKLKTVNEFNQEVNRGEIGELLQAGTQLTQGYWQSPEIDAEKFIYINNERWYRTGDLAKWDDKHGFCYVGRVDRQIKLKGYRIELQDCEAALRNATAIDLVCVIPWPKNTNGEILGLIGFVCGKEPSSNDLEKIFSQLKKSLPAYMLPDQLIFLDEFPFNINGKVDYKKLENSVSSYKSKTDNGGLPSG